MTLHDYQKRAVSAVRASWTLGYLRVLLICPTGGGKTRMAADLAEQELRSGGRVLFLAHTREIHRQAVQRMPPGTVVGMVQTLTRRAELPCDPTLVISDEAHHSVSPSHRRLLNRFGCRMVGLTATPWANGLTETWDDTVVAALPSELVRDGFLCPITVLAHGAPDTSRVRIRGDEYDPQQLAEVTNVSELRGDVLARYLDNPRPAIGFAVDRAHSRALTADFTAAGVRAEHLDGDMSVKDRDAVLLRYAAGEIDVLWNCDLLGEGLDIPGCELVIQARPLHSIRAYLQQVGRCRRVAPGKAMCHLNDHGGNLDRHGHPDLDRDYSLLPGTARRSRKAGVTVQAPRKRLVVECPAEAYQVV